MRQKSSSHAKQMLAMIAKWEKSGLKQMAWCDKHNLSFHTFYYWYKKYKTLNVKLPVSKFVPLHINTTDSPIISSHAELFFPDGKRIIFNSPVSSSYLKDLLN
jgi:hypothetical protein